jgi:hypothetical protein
MTRALHSEFPGRLLTAEITPEDPRGVHELGFNVLWVHSGYDIIQQHKALGRGHHGGCGACCGHVAFGQRRMLWLQSGVCASAVWTSGWYLGCTAGVFWGTDIFVESMCRGTSAKQVFCTSVAVPAACSVLAWLCLLHVLY